MTRYKEKPLLPQAPASLHGPLTANQGRLVSNGELFEIALLVSQRDHGIDTRGAAGGDVASDHRDG